MHFMCLLFWLIEVPALTATVLHGNQKKIATVTSNKSLQMCHLTKDREKKEDGAAILKVKVSLMTTEGLQAFCTQNVRR